MTKVTWLRSTASLFARSATSRLPTRPVPLYNRRDWRPRPETPPAALWQPVRFLAFKGRDPSLRAARDEDGRLDEDTELEEELYEEDEDEAIYEPPEDEDEILWSPIHAQAPAAESISDADFAKWESQAAQNESVETKGLTWAASALTLTRELLSAPPLHVLTLHSFKVDANRRRLYIALDKFSDPYGSPSLDEITQFTEQLQERLTEELGEDLVERLNFEVSSPGAEREVRLPFELHRFRHLPMRVVHRCVNDAAATQVLQFQQRDEESHKTIWRFAKGRHNKRVAKIREADYKRDLEIAEADIISVHLILDI